MAHGDITHIDIPYEDVDRASAFYSDVFGWQIGTPPDWPDYPMWRAPNKLSGGGLGRKDETLRVPRSYIEVASIEDAYAAIEAHGGRRVGEKHPIDEHTAWAVFIDSEGNELGLYEHPGSGRA